MNRDRPYFLDFFMNRVKSRVCPYLFAMFLLMPFAAAQEEAPDRQGVSVSVHLQEVYDAKVSLTPFVGAAANYANPVGQKAGVKAGETAVIDVPQKFLPGEFVLRIDYSAKEDDYPYPSERIIFLNDQDVVLTVNPPYINNDERTKFQEGEKENTVYSAFMKKNAEKRMPIETLRQFLLSYDRPESAVYAQAEKEFEQRRSEYNAWLSAQAEAHQDLFVSRLFQFQHIPKTESSGDAKAHLQSVLQNYFDGIDFSDPLIIRSRELTRFLDQYMRLSGMQAESREEQSALFLKAGKKIEGAASKGHPQVQAWIQEYLRRGYEAEGIK